MKNLRGNLSLPGTKRVISLLILCLILIMIGGSYLFGEGEGGPNEDPIEEAGRIEFIVAAPGGVTLRQAASFATCESGEIDLGPTDELGIVSVSKQMLVQKKCHAVLFCKERFFCGALRTARADFYEYDEMYIELAPFAIR